MYEKIRKFDADILRKMKVSEKIANSLLQIFLKNSVDIL